MTNAIKNEQDIQIGSWNQDILINLLKFVCNTLKPSVKD